MAIALAVLTYKLRYVNVFDFFVARYFLVIESITSLLLMILMIECALAYSYKVIFDIDKNNIKFGFGSFLDGWRIFFESPFNELWVQWKDVWDDHKTNDPDGHDESVISFIALGVLLLIAGIINLILFNFLIAAIIDSYAKVSENIKNQKHLNRAKILYENGILFKIKERFKNTRYIIMAEEDRGKKDLSKGG